MAEETHLGKLVVKTCAVCGGDNPSFADLLATCTQCGICEHGYCMRELTRNIPDNWICESCDETESSGEQGSDEDTLSSPSSSSDGHHEITQLPIPSIVCGKTSPTRSKKERPVGTGKVKFIPTEEVIRLTSGASENKSCILISKPGHANSDTVASLKSPKISSVTPNFSSICIPLRPRTPRPGISQTSSIFNEQASQQTIKELKEKRAAAVPTKEHAAVKYMKEREGLKEREAREKPEILNKKENDERKEKKDKEMNRALCTLSAAEHSPLDIAGRSKKGAVPTKKHAAEKHIEEREKAEREARKKAEILKKENDERKETKDKEPNEALCTLSLAEHSPLDIAGKSKKGAVPTKEHTAEKHIEREKSKERETREKAEILKKKKEKDERKEMKYKELKAALCNLSPAEHSPIDISGESKKGAVPTTEHTAEKHIEWENSKEREAREKAEILKKKKRNDERKEMEYKELKEALCTLSPAEHSPLDIAGKNKELNEATCTLPPAGNSQLDITGKGGNRYDVAENNQADIQDGGQQATLDMLRLYHVYLPALRTTWKGEFIIPNKNAPGLGGLVAQPPCKVHRKVLEFSQKMPSVLQFDMLPRLHIWADLFRNGSPDLRDVALYFFNADDTERSKHGYFELFECLETQNSMLRSYIDGVELLIFTSKQFNSDSQYILVSKLEFFFWGLFRRAKNKTNEELSLSVTCADEEMELDMVGGKDVGRVDVAVKRENHGVRRSNIPSCPPGFPEKKTTSCLALEAPEVRHNKTLKGDPPSNRRDSSRNVTDSPNASLGRGDIHGVRRTNAPSRLTGFPEKITASRLAAKAKQVDYGSPPSRQNKTMKGDPLSLCRDSSQRALNSPNAGLRRDDSHGVRRTNVPSFLPGSPEIKTPSFSAKEQNVYNGGSLQRENKRLKGNPPGFCGDSSSPNAGHGRNDTPTHSTAFRRDSSSPNTGHGRNEFNTRSPGLRGDSSSPNACHGRNDTPTRSAGFRGDRSSPNITRRRNDIPTSSPGFCRDRSSPNTCRGRNDIPIRSPGFRGDNSQSVVTSPNASHGRNDAPTCSPGFRRDNSRIVTTSPNASHGRNDSPARSRGFLENKTQSPLPPVKAERSVITSPNASRGKNDIPVHSPGFVENRTRRPLPPVKTERSVITSPNASHGRNDIPAHPTGFLENKTRSPLPPVKAERSYPEQSLEREYTSRKLKKDAYLPTGSSQPSFKSPNAKPPPRRGTY